MRVRSARHRDPARALMRGYDVIRIKTDSKAAPAPACRKQWTAGGSNDGASCTIDANCTGGGTCGSVLVTGTFTGTVDFGGTPLISGIGGLDSLVLKLNGSTGATVWAQHFMCGGGDVGYGIGSDRSGNVIVVGGFAGHFFPNANDNVFNFTSAGASDVYVVKLSGSGAYLWAKQFSGSGADTPNAVAVDGNAVGAAPRPSL